VPAEVQKGHPNTILHDRLDELLLPQIRDLLSRSQKIEAIKLVRQHIPVGLKEAKDAVDQIEAGRRTSLADLSNAPVQVPDANLYVPAANAPFSRKAAMGITVVIGMFFLLVGVGVMLAFQQAPPPVILPTEAPTETSAPPPTLIPTPQFASPVSTLGSEGIGAGKFSQANSLAIDPDGKLYVGDYVGNRIQVFDPSGKFLVQWSLDPSLHIHHLAAGLNGELYVNMGGRIFRYDPKTGQQTGEVQYTDPMDGDTNDFGNMTVGLDGSLVSTWINYSKETDTLLRFDPAGKLIQTIPNAVQEETSEFEPDIYLALDGLGNIYAVAEFSNMICEYSPQGKSIDRLGVGGGQSGHPQNIAIDSRGRIYLNVANQVQVYTFRSGLLDKFDLNYVPFGLAFDRQDALYMLASKQVNKYALRDK
jgi:sugar lactone lactonase YvrE